MNERQGWVKSNDLCLICFAKPNHSPDKCRLNTVLKGMGKRPCVLNDCKILHNYLLHDEKKTANVCTVDGPEERIKAEELTPGERLMRGLLEGAALNAGGSSEAEMSSGGEEDEIFQSEAETTRGSELEAELEPEKEKPAAFRTMEKL